MFVNLDDVDTRLYVELQRDGRASMESLAARMGLSRVATRARVHRLIESGTLRVVGIVHPSTQEIRAFAHLSITVSGSASAVGKVIADSDTVPLVSVVTGRAALVAEARAESTAALRAEVNRIAATPGVVHVESTLYTERVKDIFAPPSTITPTPIDDVDRQIIEVLARDGRASYVDIARQTNFSPSAARARVAHLLSRGVVRITTLLTPGMVGLQHMCGFGLRLRADEDGDIAAIAAMDEVSYLSLTLGRYDAIGTLLVKTQAELVAGLDYVRSLPGVEALESWNHLDVIKVDHSL
ncbi:MAG TPA: Lrp/AsnC family transcriptional regulator, partial [Acidimicrobiales bacterium]|nr:Lrp/AsnC family transcriptional regulator [Acidimicrobiales bacterium]